MSVSLLERPIPVSVAGSLPFAFGDEMDQPTFHAQYKKVPDHIHAELIGGVVYYKMPVKPNHGIPNNFASFWLTYYAAKTPGVICPGTVTLILGSRSEPEPDTCLFFKPETGGRVGLSDDGFYAGQPDLVVEVAYSTATTDLGRKKLDYERCGVQEYIVVLPGPDRVVYFIRQKKKFVDHPAGSDGIFKSVLFPGLWLDPTGLYAQDARRILRTLRKGLASPEHAAFVTAQEKKLAAAKRKKKR
jgi:Uma2 family endonuclease